MIHYTQYTVADLIDVTSQLNTMLTTPPFKSLQTILLKYSHQYVKRSSFLAICRIVVTSSPHPSVLHCAGAVLKPKLQSAVFWGENRSEETHLFSDGFRCYQM